VPPQAFSGAVRSNLPPTEKSKYVVLTLESLQAIVQEVRKTGASFRVNAAGEGS